MSSPRRLRYPQDLIKRGMGALSPNLQRIRRQVQNGATSKEEGVEQGYRILEEHYEKQVGIINKFVEKKDLIGITGREKGLREALEEAKAAWKEIILEASEAWKLKQITLGLISFAALTLAEQKKLGEPRKLAALQKIVAEQKELAALQKIVAEQKELAALQKIAEQKKLEAELEALQKTLIEEALKKTRKSIPNRVDSLTQVFNHRIVNNSLKVIAPTNNAKWMKWILHPELSKTGPCSKCRANAAGGRNGYYHVTWFTPKMPVHPNCLCEWEIVFEEPDLGRDEVERSKRLLDAHNARYRPLIR